MTDGSADGDVAATDPSPGMIQPPSPGVSRCVFRSFADDHLSSCCLLLLLMVHPALVHSTVAETYDAMKYFSGGRKGEVFNSSGETRKERKEMRHMLSSGIGMRMC